MTRKKENRPASPLPRKIKKRRSKTLKKAGKPKQGTGKARVSMSNQPGIATRPGSYSFLK